MARPRAGPDGEMRISTTAGGAFPCTAEPDLLAGEG